MKIGPNLRAVVAARGVPMDEVREALGWDRETLDRVLADRLSPGISELLRLATFLGVGISQLLGGDQESRQRAVKTGKDERIGVDRRNALHYESLAQSFAGRHLEPFVVDLYRAPETEPDLSRHPGEEFLFVLSGELQVTVDGEPFHLEAGDSLYFDSLLPHVLVSLSEHTRLMAVLYKGESMLQLTKGHGMKSLIEAARLAPRQKVVLVCPDPGSLKAVNKGIEEGILEAAFLVGDPDRVRHSCADLLIFEKQYRFVPVGAGDDHEREAARIGVELVASGQGDLLMKGGINTAVLMKAVLAKETGIGTGRRLSNVSIFELPGVERLIFLTDPAINPELFAHQEAASAIDIIENAIEVARALGVERPKVALLEANEVPSANIPTTLLEQELSRRNFPQADVYGPLSYDLALYPDSVRKKGLTGNPVAGQADIIVVPHISGGNFLYKSWVFTMGAEVANVVLGARAPIILTSRSDSELTKFLTICASSLYGHYLRRQG